MAFQSKSPDTTSEARGLGAKGEGERRKEPVGVPSGLQDLFSLG